MSQHCDKMWQKCNQKEYVPSSNSDLYNVEVVGRNLNYYSRLDLGFTQLKAYTETGDGTAVSYNKQNVKSVSLSAGLNLSKVIENEKGIFEPSLKFELGKDKTINSLSEAYYVNNSSEIYSNALGDQNSGHLLLNLGIGAKLNNNLTEMHTCTPICFCFFFRVFSCVFFLCWGCRYCSRIFSFVVKRGSVSIMGLIPSQGKQYSCLLISSIL